MVAQSFFKLHTRQLTSGLTDGGWAKKDFCLDFRLISMPVRLGMLSPIAEPSRWSDPAAHSEAGSLSATLRNLTGG